MAAVLTDSLPFFAGVVAYEGVLYVSSAAVLGPFHFEESKTSSSVDAHADTETARTADVPAERRSGDLSEGDLERTESLDGIDVPRNDTDKTVKASPETDDNPAVLGERLVENGTDQESALGGDGEETTPLEDEPTATAPNPKAAASDDEPSNKSESSDNVSEPEDGARKQKEVE